MPSIPCRLAARLSGARDSADVVQSCTRGEWSPATAQEISLPGAVDGAYEAESYDYYRFQASAGQRLAFEVVARRTKVARVEVSDVSFVPASYNAR